MNIVDKISAITFLIKNKAFLKFKTNLNKRGAQGKLWDFLSRVEKRNLISTAFPWDTNGNQTVIYWMNLDSKWEKKI